MQSHKSATAFICSAIWRVAYKTPQHRLEQMQALIPAWAVVQAAYDPSQETYVTNSHEIWLKSEET